MPQSATGDIVIDTLRGGQNDTTPQHLLPEDQCVTANNVEFWYSSLGERRAGTNTFDITNSTFSTTAVIVHLRRWFPQNDPRQCSLWGIGANPGTNLVIASTGVNTPVWNAPVSPADAFNTSEPDIYNIQSQVLGDLVFFAYHSAVSRLHVWDPNNGQQLRRVGIAPGTNAPTAADEGSGTYSGTRYFRVRFERESSPLGGSITTVRSEPTPAVTFTPSGSGKGATVTRPALPGEGETHWTLEASLDNVTFYRLTTQLAATTTVNDEVPLTTGYSTNGPVSESIGAYLLIPSAKFLAVDGGRLLYGGHWTDVTQQSTVGFTPPQNDPGVGNSERAPIVTTGGQPVNYTLILDNYEGGPLTGISNAINGVWYAFKWNRIYQLTRTGDPTNPYSVFTLSNTRGAIPGSIFQGMDENGSAAIYFLDPQMGPSRLGPFGLQVLTGLRTTWARVNLSATNKICHGIYYPAKQQAHWWVAVDGANSPNFKLIIQVSEVQTINNWGGAARGWSTADGLISQAYCAELYTETVQVNGKQVLSERPFIGLPGPNFIQRCDVGTTDNGVPYNAVILTRPYLIRGLLNRWGEMTCALLGVTGNGSNVTVRLIRDFGVETSQAVVAVLTPQSTESEVIAVLDNLAMSSARTISFQFSDN